MRIMLDGDKVAVSIELWRRKYVQYECAHEHFLVLYGLEV